MSELRSSVQSSDAWARGAVDIHLEKGGQEAEVGRSVLRVMASTVSREYQQVMNREAVKKVVEQDGELPPAHVFIFRVRYFADGIVSGRQVTV